MDEGIARAPLGRMALPSLAAAYFMLGIGSMCIVGLVVPMSVGMGVSTAAIAFLISAYGIVYAVAAPLLQMVIGDWERRDIVIAGLVTLVVGLLICAVAPNYPILFAGRMVMGMGASLIGPMVAATASSLVPLEDRGPAIAVVYTGLTLSSVIGIPLAALLGTVMSWRAVMLLLAACSAVTILVVRASVPFGSRGERATFGALGGVLRDAALLPGLLIVFFHMVSVMATYALIGAYLTLAKGVALGMMPVVLLVAGIGGVVGNIMAIRLSRRAAPDPMIRNSLIAVGIAMVLLLAVPPFLPLVLAIVFVWFVAWQLTMTPQQSRLIDLAPTAQNLVLALNASLLNLGVAAGAAVAGVAFERSGPAVLPAVSLFWMLVALGAFLLSRRAAARR